MTNISHEMLQASVDLLHESPEHQGLYVPRRVIGQDAVKIHPVVLAGGMDHRHMDATTPKVLQSVDNERTVLENALHELHMLRLGGGVVGVVTGRYSTNEYLIRRILDSDERVYPQGKAQGTLPAIEARFLSSGGEDDIHDDDLVIGAYGDDGAAPKLEDYQNLLQTMENQGSNIGVLLTDDFDPSAITKRFIVGGDRKVKGVEKVTEPQRLDGRQRYLMGGMIWRAGLLRSLSRELVLTRGGIDGLNMNDALDLAMKSGKTVTGQDIRGSFASLNFVEGVDLARYQAHSAVGARSGEELDLEDFTIDGEPIDINMFYSDLDYVRMADSPTGTRNHEEQAALLHTYKRTLDRRAYRLIERAGISETSSGLIKSRGIALERADGGTDLVRITQQLDTDEGNVANTTISGNDRGINYTHTLSARTLGRPRSTTSGGRPSDVPPLILLRDFEGELDILEEALAG